MPTGPDMKAALVFVLLHETNDRVYVFSELVFHPEVRHPKKCAHCQITRIKKDHLRHVVLCRVLAVRELGVALGGDFSVLA